MTVLGLSLTIPYITGPAQQQLQSQLDSLQNQRNSLQSQLDTATVNQLNQPRLV